MITLQLSLTSSKTVYLPIPEFPPVTIAYFPVRSYFDVSKDGPDIYFLKKYNKITVKHIIIE